MAKEKQPKGGARPGSGRPKGEETELINFRVKKSVKASVMSRYKGTINKIFNNWFNEL